VQNNKLRIYLTIGIVFILIFGFKQGTDCMNLGYIKGRDSTRCGCCGGWIIDVNGHTFLTDSIPNSKEILGKPENLKFPIAVFLDFKKARYCSDRRIIITCIIKQ
jgi:hypothetical protein